MNLTKSLFYLLMGSVASLAPAQSVELRANKVVTGTEGLVQAPVTIRNLSAAPIACHADLAHWYSTEVGRAEPGAGLVIEIWVERASGAFVLLNDKRENMPVEKLWCGAAGRAYETRFLIPLDRRQTDAATPATFACTTVEGRLACE